ncbi:MAG: hypothetical protein IAF38_11520, partial [Bacteroidia bacterium]|nr:hypothetical protein [Bacteroidia bacterium]
MQKITRLFIFILSVCTLSSQNIRNGIFCFDSIPTSHLKINSGAAVSLDTLWKFQNGDDINWAQASYNDSLWQPAVSTWLINADSKTGKFSDITWFRLRLRVAPAFRSRPLALSIRNFGACEIFVDGKNMGGFGVVSKDSAEEKRFSPNFIPLGIVFNDADTHLIAVRYSNHGSFLEGTKFKTGFEMQVAEEETALMQMEGSIKGFNMFIGFLAGLFFTLGFIHFLLWLYYRARISNLYYSVFSLCLATLFFCIIIITNSHDPQMADKFGTLYAILWTLVPVVLLLLLYSLFYERYPLICKIFLGLYAVALFTTFFNWGWGRYFYWFLLFASSVELLRIVVWAIAKKKPGGWTVAFGIL